MLTIAELRDLVAEILAPDLERVGMSAKAITADTDLIKGGYVDSMAFIGLVTAVEEKLGCHLDLAAMEDEDFATISGIARAAGLAG